MVRGIDLYWFLENGIKFINLEMKEKYVKEM